MPPSPGRKAMMRAFSASFERHLRLGDHAQRLRRNLLIGHDVGRAHGMDAIGGEARGGMIGDRSHHRRRQEPGELGQLDRGVGRIRRQRARSGRERRAGFRDGIGEIAQELDLAPLGDGDEHRAAGSARRRRPAQESRPSSRQGKRQAPAGQPRQPRQAVGGQRLGGFQDDARAVMDQHHHLAAAQISDRVRDLAQQPRRRRGGL